MRLFVALGLPEAVSSQLAGLIGGIPGARWVPPENYHLTLRFIGEVEPWRAEEVDEALAVIRAKPFDLTLTGLGLFEKAGRINALWVGIERCEGLLRLQSKVETALQRVGLDPERRRFAPHITLARTERAAPDKLISFVQAHNLFRAPVMRIEEFCLYSSKLGKEQAVYVPEVAYPLAPAGLVPAVWDGRVDPAPLPG
ncbi:RNA 2',3'-cyclic phosphodiesterase [Plastoroseomonas arctica]|uniref:RNA 2',3'-cyclic phosphodiesterase n=1 Tax=Plastoroseomonas arctica TaxID=1509237 RepID=A0AAF1K6K0_9PROT|nr:RNA 2',3'-cyclic phosphodiesterase [Plastoroseomonas arctica]MBR0657534.1 RNA 2',3'-cyclic phosphodiesterase [Plastoroseomonas arctica]